MYIEDVQVTFWRRKIIFDKISAFPTWSVLSLGFNIGYHIYVIKFFQSFHAVNMKLCTDVTCIKNICMWIFAYEKKNIWQKYGNFNLDII